MTSRKQNNAAKVFEHVKAFPLITSKGVSVALQMTNGSSSSLLSQLQQAKLITAVQRPNDTGRVVSHYRVAAETFGQLNKVERKPIVVPFTNDKQTVAQLIDAMSVKEARTAYQLLGQIFAGTAMPSHA